LVDAPIVPRLTELDLSMGTMSDDGARILHAHRDRFAHLVLHVDECYLTPAGRALLEPTVKELQFGDQRRDTGPEDRYAAAIE
jgi:hypothetical protein